MQLISEQSKKQATELVKNETNRNKYRFYKALLMGYDLFKNENIDQLQQTKKYLEDVAYNSDFENLDCVKELHIILQSIVFIELSAKQKILHENSQI